MGKAEKDGEKTQKELDVEKKAFQQSLPVEEGDQKHFGVTRRRKQFEAKTNKAKTKKDKEDFRIYQGENRSRNYARKMNAAKATEELETTEESDAVKDTEESDAAKPTEESETIRKREQKRQAHIDKWTEWRDNELKKRQMEKQKQYQKETKEWLARHGKEAQKELDAEILDFQQQLDAATKTEKDG